MADPTIEDLKELQVRLDLRSVHVCWFGETTFVIAHTDDERQRPNVPLEDCELHQWLLDQDVAPMPVGYYQTFPRDSDADSESYGAYPWDFIPLEAAP